MTTKSEKRRKVKTDEFYASYLSLRGAPVEAFLGMSSVDWVLPITSVNESRLLKELGLPTYERNEIDGIQRRRSLVDPDLDLGTTRSLGHAALRLAANPPMTVGHIQRRTSNWLLRPYRAPLRPHP